MTALAPAAPPVEFHGDRLSVRFDRFDLASYRLFLACKKLPESAVAFDPADESYTLSAPARFAGLLGAERPPARDDFSLSPFLFDDQAALVADALDAKRFALWCLCGFGKTLCGWEYARQVLLRVLGGRGLVVTTNDLVGEWLSELAKFYGDRLPAVRLTSRAQLREWCEYGTIDGVPTEARVAVTNYEKFNPEKGSGPEGQVVNECRHLAFVVLDEASKLRNSGGKQKWSLIKSCKGVEYKLLLTATPAPNELMEFASQAAFLEKMRSESDIIWTFFTRCPTTHRWTVKPHARAAFFRFMADWSVYVYDPKRYGWRQGQADVPKPEHRVIEVEATPEQLAEVPAATAAPVTGQMALPGIADAAPTNTIQRMRLSQAATGFVYTGPVKGGKGPKPARRVPSHKPGVVAGIVRGEVAAGVQVLVWTRFEEETAVLAEALAGVPGVEVLTGKVPAKARPDMIGRFKRGETRVLVTRAKLLGYGQNLQMCGAMVFSGFSDSFEDAFQAIHRAARHGQANTVRVYWPVVRPLEGDTFEGLQRKWREFEGGIEEMERNYVRTRAEFRGKAVPA